MTNDIYPTFRELERFSQGTLTVLRSNHRVVPSFQSHTIARPTNQPALTGNTGERRLVGLVVFWGGPVSGVHRRESRMLRGHTSHLTFANAQDSFEFPRHHNQ